MKSKAYDRNQAKLLVPLLESISREVGDRLAAIRELEARRSHLREDDLQATQFHNVIAELALHRRELRLAHQECEDLGCVVDESRPTRIFIPGANGDFERGFRWDAGEGNVKRVSAETETAG